MKIQKYKKSDSSERCFMLTCCLKSALNYPKQDIWLKVLASAIGLKKHELEQLFNKELLTESRLCDKIHHATFGLIPKYRRGQTKRIDVDRNFRKQHCVCTMYKRN